MFPVRDYVQLCVYSKIVSLISEPETGANERQKAAAQPQAATVIAIN
jgi:hypothetical protein